MDRKKKLAAALAAVRTYIQTEEEALLTPPAAPAAVAAQPAAPSGLWGSKIAPLSTMARMTAFMS